MSIHRIEPGDLENDDDVTEATPQQEATLSPQDAAIALKVRRETVHRWIKQGKLACVLEPNKQGRLFRRVPVSAIEAMIKQGILEELPRGAVPPLRSVPPQSPLTAPTDEQESPAILRTHLEFRQAVAHAAAEWTMQAASAPWYRPGLRRRRNAEARAAIRLLDALPDVVRPSVTDDSA